LLLQRLDVEFDVFFSGVQRQMTVPYTEGHEGRQAASADRRR
jgi:hypothetical protein